MITRYGIKIPILLPCNSTCTSFAVINLRGVSTNKILYLLSSKNLILVLLHGKVELINPIRIVIVAHLNIIFINTTQYNVAQGVMNTNISTCRSKQLSRISLNTICHFSLI
jgi:hypothetical protein